MRKDGSEYWSARELALALDYTQWRNFQKVIHRAMVACENSGHDSSSDFAEVSKIVDAGATSKPVLDYELTRYACYLIVQNGDPRKEVIALGQTYFAIQTYRQEVADHFNELSEDNRRLVVPVSYTHLKVTRPKYGMGSRTVPLTATLRYGKEKAVRVFEVRVLDCLLYTSRCV